MCSKRKSFDCRVPHGSHINKVFSPVIGVVPSLHVLDIREYAWGSRLRLALISNENPDFEVASHKKSPGCIPGLYDDVVFFQEQRLKMTHNTPAAGRCQIVHVEQVQIAIAI
jgi:hypothetical protein